MMSVRCWVELGRVAGDSMKCELYFRWSKPESGLMGDLKKKVGSFTVVAFIENVA